MYKDKEWQKIQQRQKEIHRLADGYENKTEIKLFWGLSCDRNMSGTSAIHRLDRLHVNHPALISGSSIYGDMDVGWTLSISQSTLGGVPSPAHSPPSEQAYYYWVEIMCYYYNYL